jgi:hypothetical protein
VHNADAKTYMLLGPDRVPYRSTTPGKLGGYKRKKIYGRLDCPNALMWIAKGHYVKHRVFFADEATAVAAGYHPCARCMPEQYRIWKQAQETSTQQRQERASCKGLTPTPPGR